MLDECVRALITAHSDTVVAEVAAWPQWHSFGPTAPRAP